MPWLTINEVGIFSEKPDGSYSYTGHMWYQLTDDYGNMNSYGFGPKGAPTVDGAGAINRTDSSNYLDRSYTRTIWISQARYDAMKVFGEATAKAAPDSWVAVKDINGNYQSFQLHYNGFFNSCVDYTWKAMEVGGLNPGIGINPGGYKGFLIPQFNSERVDDSLNTYESRLRRGIDQSSTYDGGSGQGVVYWDPELGYLAPEIIVSGKADFSNKVANTEYDLSQAFLSDSIPSDSYWDFTTSVSRWWLFDTYVNTIPYSLSSFTLDPIGAFYDSQSAAYDNASSIAYKTGVLVDGLGQRVSLATVQGLDANHDGVLGVAEASGLKLLTDLNENGHLDAGELNAVTSAIRSVNWSDVIRGNAAMAGYEVAAPAGTTMQQPTVITLAQPVQINKTLAVPASNYRTLRDTDNRYWINSRQWIDWTASKIKINNSTRNTLIGTDGNDSFGAGYYSPYASWFPTPLTNFLGGGGDDLNISIRDEINFNFRYKTIYPKNIAA